MNKRFAIPLIYGAFVLSWSANDALADDDIVLISQSKALAGNVAPGDGAGFPVRINRAGSYRLSSNLTVPNSDTSAVQIAADHVTLDLNGFAILGPGGTGDGRGVETFPPTFTPRFNVTVRNGTIQGMGFDGIFLRGSSNLVEHVTARSNRGSGIDLRAGDDFDASAARHNIVERNGSFGINVGVGVASHNTASANGNSGISVAIGTASYNFANRNQHHGLILGDNVNYFGNSLHDNVLGAVNGGVNQGQNLCDGAPCPGAQF